MKYKIIGEFLVDGRWPVDGYVDFGSERRPLFLEYNGCYWHGCTRCGGGGRKRKLEPLTDHEKERFKRETNAEKIRRMRKLGRLIILKECEVCKTMIQNNHF